MIRGGCLLRRSEIERMGHLFVEQCDGPNFFDRIDVVESEIFDVALGDLFDVRHVGFGENDLFYAGTFGRQNFFFEATYGKHFAAQGNLATHGQAFAHFALCEHRGDGRGQRDTGRRTVFRGGAFGDVDVKFPVIEHCRGDAEFVCVRFDILEGDGRTFAHHIADVAREGEIIAR